MSYVTGLCMGAHTHVQVRGQLQVLFLGSTALFLETGSLTGIQSLPISLGWLARGLQQSRLPHARVPTAHLSVFVGAGVITQRTSYQLTYLPSPSSLIFLICLWLFNSLLSYFLDEKLKFSTSQLRGSWPESKPQFILNSCTRLPLPGTPSPW